MTTDELVFNTISDSGVPTARMIWGPRPPEPPYATYELLPTSMFADNQNYASIPKYRCRLFQRERKEAVMKSFEEHVHLLGPAIRHVDEFEDGLLVTTYDVTVCNV